MIRSIGKTIKKIALGDADVSQQCTVGMPDPQTEIRVWLDGMRDPLDVTNNHVVACASPLTVGIGMNPEQSQRTRQSHPGLIFREYGGQQRLLARMRLQTSGSIWAGSQEMCLYQIRRCSNYCLAQHRLWAHDLYQFFVRHRAEKNPEIPMSIRGARSMNVFFICPRPVVLVSAIYGDAGNIFPMNLLGHIADGYFAFALNSYRKAAPLVERAGRVALSSIPIEQAGLVRQLGKHHRLERVNWEELPFPIMRSAAFDLPVPQFALRIREMQIEAVHKLGSHTLFFARLIRDDRLKDNLQFCMIHGIYQAWRTRQLDR
ncbi:MAG TPA: flavin reductase [Bryobacteraceae bacterium]|nr:flavin reductase [Bryobacteraceae bacterium]